MKKIIVDTNFVFSALRGKNSLTRNKIINSKDSYFAPTISNFIQAYKLCKDIDEKDTPFIALSLELELPIWTRDKVLKEGLIKKGFNSFYTE